MGGAVAKWNKYMFKIGVEDLVALTCMSQKKEEENCSEQAVKTMTSRYFDENKYTSEE